MLLVVRGIFYYWEYEREKASFRNPPCAGVCRTWVSCKSIPAKLDSPQS